MKNTFRKTRAFTLIELLVASSILMIIIVLATNIFFNVTNANNYLNLTSTLQFESKHAMERVMRAVQSNAIDYPEYYNYYVINNGGEEFETTGDNFGSNYSVYGARFYNPGDIKGNSGSQGVNYSSISEDDLGAFCYNAIEAKHYSVSSEYCDDWPTLEYTEDIATGTNPYETDMFLPPEQASAVCDLTTEMYPFVSTQRYGTCSAMSDTEQHEMDMLFLISPDGQTKTIIAREPWAADPSTLWESPEFEGGYVLSMLKMIGENNDGNPINDSWFCHEDFACTNEPSPGDPALPAIDDLDPNSENISPLEDLYLDFSPMTPPVISITDLRFYVAPIEDPAKAFDELPQKMQPYVTVIMTAELNDPRADILPESLRSITLQTTISTQYYGEIESYISD
ncbi:hypothetical protein HOG48_03735 [Candidatus Peregrinibacteria bacterium]|jgi:type II secretory pathway pseudopilin PulG|nr:hypothetical protein [Candidatus Peregrinibacteria bacterium]